MHQPPKSPLHIPAVDGDANALARLLRPNEHGVSTNEEEVFAALSATAAYGHAECVKLLLPYCDPKSENSLALRMAVRNGHTECVKLLIPHSDMEGHGFVALMGAVDAHEVACLSLLLPHCTRKACLEALYRACEWGEADLLRLIIPYCDPKNDNSEALRIAVFAEHQQCVDLLWNVSDPRVVVAYIQSTYPDEPELWEPLELRLAQEQQKMLLEEVAQHTCTPTHEPKKHKI